MSEDEFAVLVVGAAIIGLLLGPLARLLRWSPVATASIAAGSYIVLVYVVGYAIAGYPESVAKLLGGVVLVLPGILVYCGGPLVGAFALSYCLTSALTSDR